MRGVQFVWKHFDLFCVLHHPILPNLIRAKVPDPDELILESILQGQGHDWDIVKCGPGNRGYEYYEYSRWLRVAAGRLHVVVGAKGASY